MPKSFRSFAALFALAPLTVVAVIACSSSTEEEKHEVLPAGDGGTQAADVTIATDAGDGAPQQVLAPYHVIGRVDTRDATGPRFGWPGTQVRATFTGTGLTVQIRDSEVDTFDVSIDGAAPTLLRVVAGTESYEVAKDLAAGEHQLVLTKRSESYFGIAQLLGLQPTGGALVPTPGPKGRWIEWVGDSITCGYGVLRAEPCTNDAGADISYSPDTESETFAWGALASTALGANRSVVAYSGMGIYRDNSGSTAVDTMPVRYDRALADDPSSTWPHEALHPDLVVVNLSTNDYATGDPGAPFETAYGAFLAKIRTTHPNAYVVVASSPMLDDGYPQEDPNRRSKSIAALTRIVEARKTAGDAKIALLTLDEQLDSDGVGCDFHPSKVTQQKMADKLVAFVKPLLNW